MEGNTHIWPEILSKYVMTFATHFKSELFFIGSFLWQFRIQHLHQRSVLWVTINGKNHTAKSYNNTSCSLLFYFVCGTGCGHMTFSYIFYTHTHTLLHISCRNGFFWCDSHDIHIATSTRLVACRRRRRPARPGPNPAGHFNAENMGNSHETLELWPWISDDIL